jgi:phosphosulfolactate synthase
MSVCSIWDGIIKPTRTDRLQHGPRTTGITMVIDTGIGLNEMEDMLCMASEFIDIMKLGFGSSFLYDKHTLNEKIALCTSRGILICPGGTFLEIAVLQRVWERCLERCKELGFTCVEVSDGTIELPRSLRNRIIRFALELDLQVFTEVGKKEDGSHLPIDEQIRYIEEDLEAGSKRVIIEGRESGTNVGVFDADGNLRATDVDTITDRLPDRDALIWEAPLKSQQVRFIKRFGSNVNLGNIPPASVLALECLRQGLRSDTIHCSSHEQRFKK